MRDVTKILQLLIFLLEILLSFASYKAHINYPLISVLDSASFTSYEVVLFDETRMYGRITNLIHNNQILLLKSKSELHNFIERGIESKRYGRTALFLTFSNRNTLTTYIDLIASLYIPGLGQNVDTRLYTFIDWPYPINGSVGETEVQYMRNISAKFRLNAEVYILFTLISDADQISVPVTHIYEFYNVGGVSIVQKVDSCWEVKAKDNNYDCYILKRLFTRRRNFQQGVLRVTSVDHVWDQCVTSYKKSNTSVEFEGGISVQVLHEIKHALNFTIFAMRGTGYIWVQLDGYLGGVGGEVFFGSADITITLEYVLKNRVERITPLYPLFFEDTRAYFREPESDKNIFTMPFSNAAWKGVLSGFGCILIAVTFFQILKHKLHSGEWYSSESFLLITAIASQRGWYFNPTSVSARIMLISMFCFSTICYIAYSSTILASLTVDRSLFTSIRTLLRMGYRIMFHEDQGYLFFEETVVDRGVMGQSNNPFYSDDEAVNKVLNGGYIFITTTDMFRPIARRLKIIDRSCGVITSLPFAASELQKAFHVQKGSPFKDFFNVRLLLLMENGLNFRYAEQQYAKEVVTCPIQQTQKFGLDLDELKMSFIILGVGMIVSLLAFWVERLISNSSN